MLMVPSPLQLQSSLPITGGTDFFAKVVCIGVKVINPGEKNEAKLFMLRNVNFNSMDSPKDLHAVITEQLRSKTVADSTDFEVGYYTM